MTPPASLAARRVPAPVALAVVLVGLAVVAAVALATGAAALDAFDARARAVVLELRLPRVLLGIVVGAGLAASGAAMQGLLRNPLADPSLLGVSSGAALATAVALVAGGGLLERLPAWAAAAALPACAFLGAGAAAALVVRLGRRGGATSVATVLLAGLAVSALAGAGTGLITHIATDAQLRGLTFFTLGSLGGATWTQLAVVTPLVGGAVAVVLAHAGTLDALSLGEACAASLGIDVERAKRRLLVCVAIAVGAGVAATGLIGFVGLLAPHAVRLSVGPSHRVLLRASALAGGLVLVGADAVARTAVRPAELPIGVLTALLGSPLLLWLVLRARLS